MITCVIIDDEPLAVQLLSNYIAQVPSLQLLKVFYNPIEAFDFLKSNPVELIFLDINMPHLSGMQLKTLLPEDQQVIFITAYSQHAIESYEKNAVDFLMKPVTFERFLQAVNKVNTRSAFLKPGSASGINDIIFLKAGRSIIKLRYNELFYVEGFKDYVIFHTHTGKQVIYKRMKDLEVTLPPYFSRIHLSFIINRQHIIKIEDNHVYIQQAKIPISEKYREPFLKLIAEDLL